MLNKLLVAAVLAVTPSLVFAQDATIPTAAAPTAIEIHDMRFEPAILTITAGTTVTWLNEDNSPHTVSERGRAFRSSALDTSDRFSYTFAAPGEFTYFCTLHPMMVGKIIVKQAGAAS